MSSAKHSGVRALFTRHWIKTDRLPAEMGRFYNSLFDRRQEGDYEDLVTFDRTEVEEWTQEARAFVAHITEVLLGERNPLPDLSSLGAFI